MSEQNASLSNGIVYGLNDKPPRDRATVLGVQHVLTMSTSTVAAPLIFGPEPWPVPQGLPDPVAASNWYVSVATICLIIVFALVQSRSLWLFKLFPMLLAILGLHLDNLIPGSPEAGAIDD